MTENQPATYKLTYWQPSADDSITGIVQGGSVFDDAPNEEQQNLLLENDSGAVVSVTLNRYLRHSLKQNNAALGDSVTVTFHGREQKNSGRSLNRYTLRVDKAFA